MIVLPGVLPQRAVRRSALAFLWSARDCDLRPFTGQDYDFTQVGATTLAGGAITPAYGGAVTAGKAMPRFGRGAVAGLPANFLELSGTTAGQDVERLAYDFALMGQDLTLLWRFTGLWTPGGSVATAGTLLQVGVGTIDNGNVRVQRSSTTYGIIRQTDGGTSTVNLTENAALAFPADLLVTFALATGVATLSLRSATGTIYGPVSTTNTPATYARLGRFAGTTIAVGGSVTLESSPYRWYLGKIALGIQTFAQMDALT